MALALGKYNFSCAVIGLTFINTACRQTTGTPKFRGSGCLFPQSQLCLPSPRTGIALGTRLYNPKPFSNSNPRPNLLRVRKDGGKSWKNFKKKIYQEKKKYIIKSQIKYILIRTGFHFPHAAPLPHTLTASSVKTSTNKSFYILLLLII
jgi:hypothetical protein